MCGISGIIGSKANKENIIKMTDPQYHRGYDNISCNNHVAFNDKI